MSREVVIKVRDDFDRTQNAQVHINDLTLDGIRAKLDLTDEHAQELRDLLAPYFEAAHELIKVGRPKDVETKGHRLSTKETREENRRIRAWARREGYQLGATGQIPMEVREAFYALAHNGHIIDAEVVYEISKTKAIAKRASVKAIAKRAPVKAIETRKQAATSRGYKGGKRTGAIAKSRAVGEYGPAGRAMRNEIREWGRANGHVVKPRGFLKADLIEAFNVAHNRKLETA